LVKTILGLFPGFETIGGVQTSGRLAWEWVSRSVESGLVGTAHLVSYDKEWGRSEGVWSGTSTRARSRISLVSQTIRRRWAADLLLVWHISLLRLVPLFRLRNAKVVVFLHGIEAWKKQDLLTRSVLHRVSLFGSNSAYTWARFLVSNPQCERVPHRTVHLGISAAVNAQISPPRRPPIALMLSRLHKREDYKGHREMIDAWPLVLKRKPDAELWIAGDGDLRGELEREVTRQGHQARIKFLGSVSEARKQELLVRCSCLALPSRGEGFGLVYLEAMRLGRPCLVSTRDAGGEVVNPPEAGLAAEVEKPEALADAVCRLLSGGPEWLAWSRRARERYEARFTAKDFQERLSGALAPLL
jgi:glycosyltransferase involved in cell wall biosynthesis